MPLLFGAAPIRRTLQYLQAGKLLLKDRVKIMEIHYNFFWRFNKDSRPKYSDPHIGLREFYFWDVPHIQYKNPDVQIVRFLEMSPLPYIRCWTDDGQDILFDCDSKSRNSILNQLAKTLGKSSERLELESRLRKEGASGDNEHKSPAIFGFNCQRFCMCEVPDQVPCPGLIGLPKNMRGKYLYQKKDELEEWENDLDAAYMTEEEKQRLHRYYPNGQTLPLPNVPGLERMYMWKPKQTSLPKPAEELVKDHEVQTKLDKWFGDRTKYV